MTQTITEEEPLTALQLPKDFHEPKNKGIPKKLGMIIFGPAKVGKTTFACEFPSSLIIEAEPNGADFQRCKKMDIFAKSEEIKTSLKNESVHPCLKQIRKVYKLLKKDNTFETVIIDSLDKVASWIEDEVCKEVGIQTIMETKKGERHGAQWALYNEKILMFIETFLSLEKRIIFLAHTKKIESDGMGNILNPKTINLYGKTTEDVLAIVDNIGYMFCQKYEGIVKHYLSFEPGINVIAGSRHPALSGKIIELPKGKGYESFASLFKVKK
jgi:hypothetical protein